MTTSAGKISILGTAMVERREGLRAQVLRGSQHGVARQGLPGRYDEETNNVALLQPYDTEKFFFEDELKRIEDLAELAPAGSGVRQVEPDATMIDKTVGSVAEAVSGIERRRSRHDRWVRRGGQSHRADPRV